MTNPLIWNDPEHSTGEVIEGMPEIRERYGEQVEALALVARTRLRDELTQPLAQQVKAALKRLVSSPERYAGSVDALDERTYWQLLLQAKAHHGAQRLDGLPAKVLSDCAQRVLDEFSRPSGARTTDGHALWLVAQLGKLWSEVLQPVELERLRSVQRSTGVRSVAVGGGTTRAEAAALERVRRALFVAVFASCGIAHGAKNLERLGV